MATEYAEVRVVVLVSDVGDYEVGTDEEQAVNRFEENIQPVADTAGTRQVVVTLRVPLPKPIELSGAVECDETGAGLTVT